MLLKKALSQTGRLNVAAFVVLASGTTNVAQAQKPGMLNLSPAEQTAQESPTQPEADLQRGIELTRSGRFTEAIPHFLMARGHVSNEYATEFNLALCYVGLRKFQDAVGILTKLRTGNHEGAAVENLLSQAYVGNDEVKEAFEAFQRAVAFTPGDEKLYLLVTAAFLEKEEYTGGLKVIQCGLQNLPDSARLNYELGYVLWQLEEQRLAMKAFEKAKSLTPRSAIGYLAAAQESFMLGDLVQAIQIARAGIREGILDYQLLALLGDALIREGASPGQPEFSEAKHALEKSIAAHPNYASSQIALGRVLLQEGRWDAAIEHLELGRQLAPQNPSSYFLLATAYRKRGQLDQARAMLAMVAKLNEEQAEKRRQSFDQDH